MKSKKEKDQEKYHGLIYIKNNITHVENGDIVPNNPKYYNEVVAEIEQLEKDNPDFNFLKDLEG